MSENLKNLPRYDYVGPNAQDQQLIDRVDNHLRTTQLFVDTEEIQSQEYEAQFRALSDTVQELGSDLGLNLEDRVRPTDYFHLYDSEGYDSIRDKYGLSEQGVAVNSAAGHMMALEGHSSLTTLANLGHELVHVASRRSIRPTISEIDGKKRMSLGQGHDGYESLRHGAFHGLNEILTEATIIDLMRNYWPNHPELVSATEEQYKNIGYLPELIFFDELLKMHFVDPRAVFKELQKGMFTGDMTPLKNLSNAIGNDTMRKIALNLNDTDHPEKALALAEQLGLNEAARKIRTFESEGLLTWL